MGVSWLMAMPRPALVSFCLAALFLLHSPCSAQQKAETPVGRYEVQVPTSEDYQQYPLMIDTTTGECWMWYPVGDEETWVNLKFPVKDTKVAKGVCGRFRLQMTYRTNDRAKPSLAELVVWDTANGRSWRASSKDFFKVWKAIRSPRSK